MTADYVALVHLDALTVTLGDTVMHLHIVAHKKRGDVVSYLLLLDCSDDIHGSYSFS